METAEREALWVALADLWLDTELDEAWLRRIAEAVRASGCDPFELERVLRRELAPFLNGNVRTPAGEWAGFDPAWVVAGARRARAAGPLVRGVRSLLPLPGAVRGDLDRVRALVWENEDVRDAPARRSSLRVGSVLTAIGALALLVGAAWPGALRVFLLGFPQLFLVVPLLACWIMGLVLLGGVALVAGPPDLRRTSVLALATMALAALLVRLDVPQRVALALHRDALAELLEEAANDAWSGPPLDRRVGLYRVERVVRDARGGVYLRTLTGPGGIGPVTLSYGFAHRPNAEGSPFGNAQYELRPLGGEWFAFSASDDF